MTTQELFSKIEQVEQGSIIFEDIKEEVENYFLMDIHFMEDKYKNDMETESKLSNIIKTHLKKINH